VLKAVFWISALFILYTYAGYPLLIFIWSKVFPRRVARRDLEPAPLVSIVIAARNEEDEIRGRILNLFEQEWPEDKLEIIVVSDGSKDATNEIVTRLALEDDVALEGGALGKPRLRLIAHDVNRGKPAALNAGLSEASGEFVVFTDARQRFEPDAVRRLVSNFADPSVGAVSGELLFREDSETDIKAEMGLYWNYEKWIRRTESAVHSAAGATGAIYAARRALVTPIPEETILDDVLIPMRCVMKGMRTVFDTRALAWDRVSRNLAAEKRRKVRTLLGNYQLVRLAPSLLDPRRNPIFLQFVSHKLFRLLVPFFFVLMMLSALLSGGAYTALFLVILAGMALPLLEGVLGGVPGFRALAALSRTFVSLNWFALLAFLLFIRPGERRIW